MHSGIFVPFSSFHFFRVVGQHGPACRLCPILFCFKFGDQHGCKQFFHHCLLLSPAQRKIAAEVPAISPLSQEYVCHWLWYHWVGQVFLKHFLKFNHPLLYTVAIIIVAVVVCFPYLISVFFPVNCYLNSLSLPLCPFLMGGVCGKGTLQPLAALFPAVSIPQQQWWISNIWSKG